MIISFKRDENKDKVGCCGKKNTRKYLMDGNKRQMLVTVNLAQLSLWLVLKR